MQAVGRSKRIRLVFFYHSFPIRFPREAKFQPPVYTTLLRLTKFAICQTAPFQIRRAAWLAR
jgi:hypothetical protein